MSYLNVSEIESALQNLVAAYPSTSELIALPHVSHEGRSVHALRVGKNQSTEADGLLVLGGVHAREWIPPDALISLAADLLEAYQINTGLVYQSKSYSATEINTLLTLINLFIIPCVNPDGRHYSQASDPNWRKNRRPSSSGGGPNCIGVDLNRNFDFLWDHLHKFAPDSGVNTSSNSCDKYIYRGPSSASEPETKNVVWLLDNNPRIRWFVDVHSAVPVILHSWGSDKNQTTDPSQSFQNAAFDTLRGRANDTAYKEYITLGDLHIATSLGTIMNDAIKAVRNINYGVEQAYSLYPTSGASDDYAFSRHFSDSGKTKTYGFTVECGSSFQPSWDEAENVIKEVSAGLIAFGLHAPSVTGSLDGDSKTVPQSGNYTIQQKSNNRFLDGHESSDKDFSVITRTMQNNDTQKWILTQVGGVYTIQQKSNNRFLDAHENAAEDFMVVTRSAQKDDTQRWVLLQEQGNPCTYTIQQLSSRRFMDAHEHSGKDYCVVTRTAQRNDTQKWCLKPLENNIYTIQQKSTNRFVDAHESSGKDFSVVTRTAQNNDSQRWILKLIGGVYTIQQKSNGRLLDAHEKSAKDFSVVSRITQNNDTQRWVLLPLGGDTYTIQQLSNSRLMDAHEHSGKDYSVVTRTAQKNDSQNWLIKKS